MYALWNECERMFVTGSRFPLDPQDCECNNVLKLYLQNRSRLYMLTWQAVSRLATYKKATRNLRQEPLDERCESSYAACILAVLG
jgi:hypothetical protein